MKRSILLLIGLFLLITAGVFMVKYQLNEKYKAIDKTDSFYEFNAFTDLDFKHIKISGGNDSHVHVEYGAENMLYIYKQSAEDIQYTLNADTLSIHFDSSRTTYGSTERIGWNSRKRASIIIQSNTLASLIAENASVEVDLKNSNSFFSNIHGASHLSFIPKDEKLAELNLRADSQSKIRINKDGKKTDLALIELNLMGQSSAELYNIHSDSTVFELDSTSRISGDAIFFK